MISYFLLALNLFAIALSIALFSLPFFLIIRHLKIISPGYIPVPGYDVNTSRVFCTVQNLTQTSMEQKTFCLFTPQTLPWWDHGLTLQREINFKCGALL